METISGNLSSELGSQLGSEEYIVSEQIRNLNFILRNAHMTLLPNTRYAHDVVNECNMIKVAIRDLVISQEISESRKYSILLQLAADSNLQINPDASLRQIGSAVQDYYMNVCLAVPGAKSQLALLWGLGVRQQVSDYSAYCDSISRKVAIVFGEAFDTPRHVATMLYDPEVGLLAGLEMRLNAGIDLDAELVGKWYANHIILWKITTPDGFQDMYDRYGRALEAFHDADIGDHVKRVPEISESEAELFRNFHKGLHDGSKPYSFTVTDVMNNINVRNNVDAPKLTRGEVEFIMMVRDRFLRGEYPIDMLWSDVCK